MRAIHKTGEGILELNYMWLPTWIGENFHLKKKIEAEIGPKLVGKALDDDLLDEAHGWVVELLEREFPAIKGLKDYLDGMKFIHVAEDGSD